MLTINVFNRIKNIWYLYYLSTVINNINVILFNKLIVPYIKYVIHSILWLHVLIDWTFS